MRNLLRLKFTVPRVRWQAQISLRTHLIAESSTLPQNLHACQDMIEECVRESRPQEAEDILKEMLRYEMKPDVILYTSVINSYAEADLSEDAARIHQEMIDSGVDPNVVSYTTVMKAFGRATKPQNSEKVFQEMVGRGIMPNTICFSTLVHAFARSSLPSEAERILRSSRNHFQISPSRLIYHPVIGGYNLVAMPDEAERLLHEMISLQLANDDSFAMVVDAYANARRLSDAERIYNLSIELGIAPSPVTSNSLLKAFSNCERPERAEEMLNKMIRLRQCDVISYNTVMTAFLNSFQPLQSERIYKMMLSSNLHSSPECSEVGQDASEVQRLSAAVQPNLTTYQILLAGYLQRKDPKRFYEQFDELLGLGYSLQTHATHYFLHLFCQISPQEAEKFLQTLEAASPSSVDLIAYQLVIQSYVRRFKPTEAYRLLNQYFQSRSSAPLRAHPDNHFILLSTYNSVIHGYCQVNRPSVAERLLNELQSRGIIPDTYTYTTLISAYSHQVAKETKSPSRNSLKSISHATSRIQHLLSEIDRRQLPYTEALYSILIRKFIQESRLSEMNTLLEKMRAEGIEWDIVIYSQVMLAYAQSGDLDTVERLYDEMSEENGIQPNSFIFQALIIASKRSGNPQKAKDWYHRAVKMLRYTEKKDSLENKLRQDQVQKMQRGVQSDLRYLKSVLEREERLGPREKQKQTPSQHTHQQSQQAAVEPAELWRQERGSRN
jgi:pentatricopeptide repeat protein